MKELLEGTSFEKNLVTSLLSFVPDHMKASIEDKTIDYSEYGEENEIKLKTIVHYFSNIYNVLEDLEKTIEFLKKDRDLILEHYPHFESQEDYYSYFFENYYIRLLTVSDIIGKLGVLVYSLEINVEKANAYNFKSKARKEDFENIAVITEKLIAKLQDLKQHRHNKLHTGASDIKPFAGIVIWSDLNKLIGEEVTDQILQDHNDEEIAVEIKSMEDFVKEIIDIIKEFLEEADKKLQELIEVKNDS